MDNNIIKGLNPMQQQAVLHTKGPLLLLAGAGSGKTRVLTHRIAHLIDSGVSPYNILAITFTNKAAKEMKERVEKITPRGSYVWVATFHSTCVRILRKKADRLGYSNHFTIYDTSDCEKLIKDIIKEFNIDDKQYRPKQILSFISSRKNEGITAEKFRRQAQDFREEKIAEIFSEYQSRLFKSSAFDFDDLILKTTDLFRLFPDVLAEYQNRFEYILIDEYQDTNTVQYDLVNLLASKSRNLCVVGDDDQSIYAFRGANIRNILDFEKDYPEAKVIKLEQNYRSSATILNAANSVISHNQGRKGKTLWTDKGEGEPITYFRAETDRDEAMFIADNIKRLVNREGLAYNRIAVLYRNNALSRAIGEGMVRASIPYVVLRGHSFYETAEIKDMMAYLKAIYNPDSEVDLLRIINVPRRGIGDTTINKMLMFAHDNGVSLYDVIKNTDRIPQFAARSKKITEFRDMMERLIDISRSSPVSVLLDEIYWQSGYMQALGADGDLKAQGRIENLYELQSKAAEFEEQNPDNADLAAFLDEISLVSDTDNIKGEDGAVALLTLHASKGLEFPVVFLAGFEDGIFPSALSVASADPKEIEEERRLLYVGITRAKERLFITCSRTRMQRGEPVFNPPSRFFGEIPKEYIKNISGGTDSALAFSVGSSGGIRTYPSGRGSSDYGRGRVYKAGTAAARATPSTSKISYKPGDKVKQIKYGIGTVLNVSTTGGDSLLTIEFGIGIKKLYAGMVKPV